MTASKHTPGPWRVDDPRGGSVYVTTSAMHIARMESDNARTDSDNAKFIVRACNAHDALLAALRDLVAVQFNDQRYIEAEMLDGESHNECMNRLADAARAELSKAEGR